MTARIHRYKSSTRWFQVTFLSPSWRSLNAWKGHLTIPKRSQRIARHLQIKSLIYLSKIHPPSLPKTPPRYPSTTTSTGLPNTTNDLRTVCRNLGGWSVSRGFPDKAHWGSSGGKGQSQLGEGFWGSVGYKVGPGSTYEWGDIGPLYGNRQVIRIQKHVVNIAILRENPAKSEAFSGAHM